MKPSKIKHIDLFSGIGGFAYAADQVWPEVEHIFCDNDKFCQQLLKLRWPKSKIYGDIRSIGLDPDPYFNGCPGGEKEINPAERGKQTLNDIERCFILTGGFPCQPFSQAGKRRGTSDDRYLWPEMLRVIREFKPTWVIAENVRGLLTQGGGLVFEQVCTDMEAEGYEVQPFIIPACAVNAPHRRDRIWFIAHVNGKRSGREEPRGDGQADSVPEKHRPENSTARDPKRTAGLGETKGYATDTGRKPEGSESDGFSDRGQSGDEARIGTAPGNGSSDQGSYDTNAKSRGLSIAGRTWGRGHGFKNKAWERNWIETASEICRMDDGLSVELDGYKLTKSRHRIERIKSLGNAIVPQVAIEIMTAIKKSEEIC